jgi:hypothetical protein
MLQALQRNRRSAMVGFLWGLVAPLIGLNLGLTLSPTIGTLLTLPWIALSAMMDQGMLELPPAFIIAAFLISGAIWSILFIVIAALATRLQGQ